MPYKYLPLLVIYATGCINFDKITTDKAPNSIPLEPKNLAPQRPGMQKIENNLERAKTCMLAATSDPDVKRAYNDTIARYIENYQKLSNPECSDKDINKISVKTGCVEKFLCSQNLGILGWKRSWEECTKQHPKDVSSECRAILRRTLSEGGRLDEGGVE